MIEVDPEQYLGALDNATESYFINKIKSVLRWWSKIQLRLQLNEWVKTPNTIIFIGLEEDPLRSGPCALL